MRNYPVICRPIRVSFHLILALTPALCAVAPAAAAEWKPDRTVKLVVHVAPGSGADVFARFVADTITRNKLLPEGVEVLNKAGGAGAVAINFFAQEKGNATYLMGANNYILTTPMRQKGIPTYHAFQPVAILAHDTNTIQVLASSPYRTIKDLVEAARRNPKKVTHAFGAFGGTDHIIGHQLAKAAGVEFSFVGFKGGAETTAALLGGHVSFTSDNPSETRAYVKAGQLRVLAVVGDRRLPVFPDVPTLKELGLNLGPTYSPFRGFVAPAGVPKEAINAYAAMMRKVTETPTWKRYVHDNELVEEYMGPAEMAAFMKRRNDDLAKVLAEIGKPN